MQKLNLESGPATLIPLVHVPLLKVAPRREGEYKVVPDSLGDLCHFYGNFAGYHLYLIASTYKKRIVEDTINYYDKTRGLFSLSLSAITDSGKTETIRVEECSAPLHQIIDGHQHFPEHISVEQFSPGTPDALKFHFLSSQPKFKFSNNLIPHIPESLRFSGTGLFDLRIEYIGKAIGKDGTREVADRLGNGHSTESQILNEFVHKKANRDVYAVLYKPGQLTDSFGKELSFLSYSDVVDIFEKSLIGAFKPNKNKQSLSFPNDGSQTVEKLVNNGIDALWITICSPKDYGLLLSDEVAPERVHRFDLKIRT
ncbi:MAG: hypothetical protein HY066_03155 [Betaproteobacteria bacterium]|nr:hypothetical protein [Betaproteobacteria bacterium]